MTKIKREKSFEVYRIPSKCRESFHGFVLKALPLLKVFIGKTFVAHQKFAKTAKLFSCIAFVAHGTSKVSAQVPCMHWR